LHVPNGYSELLLGKIKFPAGFDMGDILIFPDKNAPKEEQEQFNIQFKRFFEKELSSNIP
jgi:hypothetical protein